MIVPDIGLFCLVSDTILKPAQESGGALPSANFLASAIAARKQHSRWLRLSIVNATSTACRSEQSFTVATKCRA